MADKSVHRERVEFKNTVKLEKAVTVEGAGLEQVVVSAETTIPASHTDNSGNTDIVFPTIPANSVILDFGVIFGALLNAQSSGTFSVSLGKGGSQTNLMAAKTMNQAGNDIAAGAAVSVSGGAANKAASSAVATLAFADAAPLASTTAVTDLTARFNVGTASLVAPSGVRAFVKYALIG
tara:strand:- start:6365 stop:6901 length:537 start_codon:yes stop_codon:yes gene_type:complete